MRTECTAPVVINGREAESWVEISTEVGNARLRSGTEFIWLNGATVEASSSDGSPVVPVKVLDQKKREVTFTMKKSLWQPRTGTGFKDALNKTIADLAKPAMKMRLAFRKKLLPTKEEAPKEIPIEVVKKDEPMPFSSPIRNKKVSILQQSPSRLHPRLSLSPSSPRKQEMKSPFRSPFGKKSTQKRWLSPSAASPSPLRAKTFEEDDEEEAEWSNNDNDSLASPPLVRPVRSTAERLKDLDATMEKTSSRLRPSRLIYDESPTPPPTKVSPARRLPPKLQLDAPIEKKIPLTISPPPEENRPEDTKKEVKAATEDKKEEIQQQNTEGTTDKGTTATPNTKKEEAAAAIERITENTQLPIAKPELSSTPAKSKDEKQKNDENDSNEHPAKKDGFSQLLLGAKRQAALNANTKSSGLVNLGNSCYMNAVLQALLSLQSFVACLRDDAWVTALTKQALSKGYWSNKANKEAYEFYLCFKEMIKGHVQSAHLDPGPMKAVVGKRAQAFANNAQQDAHEFLMNVLFELEEDMKGVLRQQREIVSKNTEQKKASKQSIHQYFGGSSQSDTQATDIDGLLPTTTFFQTTITQTLTCTSCGYSRHVNETFRELPLDFPPAVHAKPTLLCHCQRPVHRLITKKEGENKGRPFFKCSQFPQCKFFQWDDNPANPPEALDVPQLLSKHFEAYSVDVKCEKCSDGATAKVTSSIHSAPPVLVFHLKRFEISSSTHTLVKRNDVVATPITIDINAYREPSAKSKPTYHIKSIIRHIGKSAGEGHYVTDIRQDKGSKWTRYNDAHVSEIDAAQVLQGAGAENGYLLFYVRDK